MTTHLWSYFERPFRTTPEKLALVVEEGRFTYAQVGAGALATSHALRGLDTGGPFVGLFAYRTFTAHAGILGILHAGKAYVPLNPHLPPERLRTIATTAGLRVIVADELHLEGARALAASLDDDVRVVLLQRPDAPTFPANDAMIVAGGTAPAAPLPGEEAYMLFTSGSTGLPKGVPIRHRNVIAYIEHLLELTAPRADDRFSQLFEPTFDLSVHDNFLCWAAGASLHVVPQAQLMAPARFAKEEELTFWFSVPSSAILLDRLRMLKPGAFPHLRVSLFCGEALPEATALKWKTAAPNSRVLNVYGPTEATIAITAYELTEAPPKARHGILCIGRIFPGSMHLLLDEHGQSADRGELLLGGPQLSTGYWQDPERTAKAFVTPPGRNEVFYRTGDRVERDADGDLYFIARMDDQVKVRGHRIELGEITHVLKDVSGAAFAYAVAHPVREGMAQGIEAFLPAAFAAEQERIIAACAQRLPDYMVPTRLHFTDDIPYNTSGKADLRALRARLEAPALG